MGKLLPYINGVLSALFASMDLFMAYILSQVWDVSFDRALLVVILMTIHFSKLSLDAQTELKAEKN